MAIFSRGEWQVGQTAAHITRLLDANGISLPSAAILAGISFLTLRRELIEDPGSLSVDTLLSLAAGLGVEPAALMPEVTR